MTKSAKGYTIELMINQVKAIIVSPNRTPLKIGIGVLILVLLSLVGFKYYQSKFLPQPKPGANILDTCSLTKEGNPLAESLSDNPLTVTGNFKGKLTDLKFDPVLESHFIYLTSLNQKQSYKFMVPNKKGLIFTPEGEASSSALQNNQTLQVSFICDKKSNGFTITRVLIQK